MPQRARRAPGSEMVVLVEMGPRTARTPHRLGGKGGVGRDGLISAHVSIDTQRARPPKGFGLPSGGPPLLPGTEL